MSILNVKEYNFKRRGKKPYVYIVNTKGKRKEEETFGIKRIYHPETQQRMKLTEDVLEYFNDDNFYHVYRTETWQDMFNKETTKHSVILFMYDGVLYEIIYSEFVEHYDTIKELLNNNISTKDIVDIINL